MIRRRGGCGSFAVAGQAAGATLRARSPGCGHLQRPAPSILPPPARPSQANRRFRTGGQRRGGEPGRAARARQDGAGPGAEVTDYPAASRRRAPVSELRRRALVRAQARDRVRV